MKIVCIGDTHNLHALLDIPEADVIIHTGDFTDAGTKRETMDFINWFIALPHPHKIFIAGNHDYYFQKLKKEEIAEILPANMHYLENSGIQIEDKYFWGSPYTPGSKYFAFAAERGKDIAQHWRKIPKQTNILVTHTPPYGILDVSNRKQHVGCEELLKSIKENAPQFHIFGHIHGQNGLNHTKLTTFVNATSTWENLKEVLLPVRLSIS